MVQQREPIKQSTPRESVIALPFLKWAGGKGRLLRQYASLFPATFQNYFEPFLGGGAVYFHLSQNRKFEKAFISDYNPELTNCYKMVQKEPKKLLALLSKMRNDKHLFYKERARDVSQLTDLERAARLIYLNRTCFNGLYRVNSQGEFNVPFGRYKNPRIADAGNLMAASAVLQNAAIYTGSFENLVSKAKRGDFVYFDPPYQPVSRTASFTSYTKNSFNLADQARLARLAALLHERGVLVMVSNSDTEEIRDLYKSFDLTVVKAARAINCRADGRGVVNELVLRSYK